MLRKSLLLALATIYLVTSNVAAAEPTAAPPGKQDKCPVCGMFVYKYPDWVGQITFADGSTFYFDGAKDLFKYFFRLDKYNPAKTTADIAGIWVTEYYDMTSVRAESAYYVTGSDVYGPMGKELIPFQTAEAAEEFKKDHKGTGILVFDQIDPAVIEKLD